MITIEVCGDIVEFSTIKDAVSGCIEKFFYKDEINIWNENKPIFITERKHISNTNKSYYLISVEYTAFNYMDELRVIIDAVHEFNKLQAERIVNLMTNR